MSPFDDVTMEGLVSRTLRIGVYVSTFFLLSGFIVSLVNPEMLSKPLEHPSLVQILQLLKPDTKFFTRILDPLLLFYLGIFTLMLTPVLRVVVAIFSFSQEKDIRFVLISVGVLVILLISFYLSST